MYAVASANRASYYLSRKEVEDESGIYHGISKVRFNFYTLELREVSNQSQVLHDTVFFAKITSLLQILL